jgi:clan AA aspartic protease
MGRTFVDGTVFSPTNDTHTVRFLVDSGATYSLLPAEVWTAIGLEPKRSLSFILADGTEVKRDVSECRLELLGQEAHSPVILGQPGDEALLGAVTLEILGLMLDPFKRTLHTMRMRLA